MSSDVKLPDPQKYYNQPKEYLDALFTQVALLPKRSQMMAFVTGFGAFVDASYTGPKIAHALYNHLWTEEQKKLLDSWIDIT